jgi:WD40 repeat protein
MGTKPTKRGHQRRLLHDFGKRTTIPVLELITSTSTGYCDGWRERIPFDALTPADASGSHWLAYIASGEFRVYTTCEYASRTECDFLAMSHDKVHGWHQYPCLSPDGLFLVVRYDTTTVYYQHPMHDGASLGTFSVLAHLDNVEHVVGFTSNSILVTAGKRSITWWHIDVSQASVTHEVELAHPLPDNPRALAVTADGQTIAIAGRFANAVTIVRSDGQTDIIPLDEDDIYTLCWSPDGQMLIIIGLDTFQFVRMPDLQCFPIPVSVGIPTSVVWSPDGVWLAGVDGSATVSFWSFDATTGLLAWFGDFSVVIPDDWGDEILYDPEVRGISWLDEDRLVVNDAANGFLVLLQFHRQYCSIPQNTAIRWEAGLEFAWHESKGRYCYLLSYPTPLGMDSIDHLLWLGPTPALAAASIGGISFTATLHMSEFGLCIADIEQVQPITEGEM